MVTQHQGEDPAVPHHRPLNRQETKALRALNTHGDASHPARPSRVLPSGHVCDERTLLPQHCPQPLRLMGGRAPGCVGGHQAVSPCQCPRFICPIVTERVLWAYRVPGTQTASPPSGQREGSQQMSKTKQKKGSLTAFLGKTGETSSTPAAGKPWPHLFANKVLAAHSHTHVFLIVHGHFHTTSAQVSCRNTEHLAPPRAFPARL